MIFSIEFSPNSQLHSIWEHAFNDSSIEVLTIPGSVSKFNNISVNNKLIQFIEYDTKTKVLVSESNKNFKSVYYKLILGEIHNSFYMHQSEVYVFQKK